MTDQEISNRLSDCWYIIEGHRDDLAEIYLVSLEGVCAYGALFGSRGHKSQPLTEFADNYVGDDDFRHACRSLMHSIKRKSPREDIYKNLTFQIADFRNDSSRGQMKNWRQ